MSTVDLQRCNHSYFCRRQEEDEGTYHKFSQYVPSRLLIKLGKVVVIVVMLCVAVLIGHAGSSVLKGMPISLPLRQVFVEITQFKVEN